jgi:uncharacterized membrane protein (DUF441 family)
MNITNKSNVGKILYILPIVVLLIYVVIVITSKNLPTNKVTGSFLSSAIFISTFSSLLTSEIGIRGYGTVKRSERPSLFWFVFVFQCLLGTAALIFAYWG